MQQMLSTVQTKLYMNALGGHMYQMMPDEVERIIDCQWFVSPNMQWPYQPYKSLLVLTSHHFYFLKEPLMLTEACSVCPPEKFCPEGPTFVARYTYDKLVKIVRGFGGMRLRLFFNGFVFEPCGPHSLNGRLYAGGSASLRTLREV